MKSAGKDRDFKHKNQKNALWEADKLSQVSVIPNERKHDTVQLSN